MQSRYAIIAAVVVVFLAVQIFVLSGPKASSDVLLTNGSMNIQQLTIDHPAKDLPLQIVENPI